jgi:hypothetical protein
MTSIKIDFLIYFLLLVWRHAYEEEEAGWIDAVLRSSVGCKYDYIITIKGIGMGCIEKFRMV